nr:tyrosine-type recombinase/integrase [Fervidobacterium sp.]
MKSDEITNLVQFPGAKPNKKTRSERVKNVDGVKYFNASQIKLIRRRARDRAELDLKKGKTTAIREWMAIDLLTSTGLRVSEAANLKCGDLKIGYSESKIYVNSGKGGISGHVVIGNSMKGHLKAFLAWKQSMGERVGDNDHLFMGQR